MIKILLWILVYIVWGHVDSPLPFWVVVKEGMRDEEWTVLAGNTWEGTAPPEYVFSCPDDDEAYCQMSTLGPFTTRAKAEGYLNLLLYR